MRWKECYTSNKSKECENLGAYVERLFLGVNLNFLQNIKKNFFLEMKSSLL